jgi:hypothetical protein
MTGHLVADRTQKSTAKGSQAPRSDGDHVVLATFLEELLQGVAVYGPGGDLEPGIS